MLVLAVYRTSAEDVRKPGRARVLLHRNDRVPAAGAADQEHHVARKRRVRHAVVGTQGRSGEPYSLLSEHRREKPGGTLV